MTTGVWKGGGFATVAGKKEKMGDFSKRHACTVEFVLPQFSAHADGALFSCAAAHEHIALMFATRAAVPFHTWGCGAHLSAGSANCWRGMSGSE